MKRTFTRNALILLCFTLFAFSATANPLKLRHYSNKGGDFTLIDGHEKKVSLNDFKGKAVLLYFGYASCPDVCPTSLSTISEALEMMGEQKKDVRVIFISVDTKRDKGKMLVDYAAHFGPSFTALSGKKEDVFKVTQQYGARYRFINNSDSALGYAVEHTSITYLIDPFGRLRYRFTHNTPKSQLAEGLKLVLEGQ